MSYWFGAIFANYEKVLHGPFEQLPEAKKEFQEVTDVVDLIDIFMAFDEERARYKLDSMTFKPLVDAHLPVCLREAYKLGQKGGRNPFVINSQQCNDFERGRDKSQKAVPVKYRGAYLKGINEQENPFDKGTKDYRDFESGVDELERNLPLTKRKSYLLGRKGGDNPYKNHSQRWYDFERGLGFKRFKFEQ